MLNKLHGLSLLVCTCRYDFILISGTWLIGNTANRDTAIIAYDVFRKDGISKHGGGCFICTGDTLSGSWYNHSTCNNLKGFIWLTVAIKHQDS